MKLFDFLSALLIAACIISAFSTEESASLDSRADASLVGYLGVFFLGDQPSVYFYLSDGNNAVSFKALNGGSPILIPTVGTKGIRDPSIIKSQDGTKWYIVGTDLNIASTTWDAAQRTGSRGIFVWESTDLNTWSNQRLVTVENANAGMVWAPDAIWDVSKGQYLVHWASRFYSASDTEHTGASGADIIRYAYTSDFTTFSTPATLIDYSPTSVIDLSILPLSSTSYVRFLKNETATNVFMERSDDGLFGIWTRPGGANAIIRSSVEGPYAFMDNLVAGKATLLLDYFGGDGYHPFTSTTLGTGNWTDASRTNFPTGLRHGSVVGVTQTQYDALNAKWG